MKNNSIKAIVMAAVMICLSNINVSANNLDEATAVVKTKIKQVENSLSFNVWAENLSGKKVMVIVTDKDGNEIHREYVSGKAGKFAKTFDLSNLSDGKYSIEVVADNSAIVEAKTFEIKTNFVSSRNIVAAGSQN